jgi:Holliday junction resolvase RusA-like endonuclease
MKYRSFRDAVKLAKVQIKESRQHIIFHVAMPDSWSKKKRAIFLGQPHQQTPDVDNFLKALLDSVFGNDSHVWDIRASKVWGEEGMIIVEDINDS